MASLKDIKTKYDKNGYSNELVNSLVEYLKELDNSPNFDKRNIGYAEASAFATEVLERVEDKNKNTARVLTEIAYYPDSINFNSTRFEMLKADVYVNRVGLNNRTPQDERNAFNSVTNLMNAYKRKSWFSKLFSGETRALKRRITTLTDSLYEAYDMEAVDGLLSGRLSINESFPIDESRMKEISKADYLLEKIEINTNQLEEEEPLLKKIKAPKRIEKPVFKNEINTGNVSNDISPEEWAAIAESEKELAEFYPQMRFIDPAFDGVLDAFYPVYDKNTMDYDDYVNTLLNRVVNVNLNEKNLEYVLLATYNVNQLNDIKAFIENSPNKNDLEYLVNPLNYKLKQLADTTLVDTTKNDKPCKVEAYKCFIIKDSTNGYLNAVKATLDEGITSYESFSLNPNIISNDRTTDKKANDKMVGAMKYATAQSAPSDVVNGNVAKANNSLLITMPPMAHQSSDNGCWSCSLQAQLNHFGVDLEQEQIRALRPTFDTNDKDKNPLIVLRNRITFAKTANKDDKVALVDYSELITNTVKNSIVHHMEINNDPIQHIKSLLDKYNTPISCTNGAHYLTFVGYEGNKLIYQDSLNTSPVVHDNLSPELHNKYKDYCVSDCNKYFVGSELELTWVEKVNNKTDIKPLLKNMDYNNSIIRNTGVVCFNRIDNPLDMVNRVSDNIIISLADAKELGVGPYEIKNLNIDLNDKNNSEKTNQFDDKGIDKVDESMEFTFY